MVMKLTLLSIVLAVCLVTAQPTKYNDVKRSASLDQRDLKNVHGDFHAVNVAKRGPTNLGEAIGDVVNAALDRQTVADATKGTIDAENGVGGVDAAADVTKTAIDAENDDGGQRPPGRG